MDVAVTVDIGDELWKGNVGLVTSLIDRFDLTPGTAAICGPPCDDKCRGRKAHGPGISQGGHLRLAGEAHEMRGRQMRALRHRALSRLPGRAGLQL